MSFKKKIISVVLAIASVIPTFCVWAEDEAPQKTVAETNTEIRTAMQEEFSLIEYLGVLKNNNDIDLSGAVTKNEYVSALLKMFGYSGDRNNQVDFPDIDKSASYYPDMVAAYYLGIVEGDNEGNYLPEGGVTVDTAAKMLVSAMGGFYKKLATSTGGYPNGYTTVLREMNSFKNVKTADGYLTYAGMVKVLFNTLFAKDYDISIDGKNIEKSEDTILEKQYNIERLTGIVTASSFYKQIEDEAYEGCIEIDGQKYDLNGASGADDEKILGQKVYYYLRHESRSNNDDGEIVILNPVPGKNIFLELTDEEIEKDSTLDRVNYEKDGDTKSRFAKISKDAVYFYNGKICFAMTDDDMSPEPGRIRLLDNNADGTYDYVFVSSYEEHLTLMSTMWQISDKYTDWTLKIDSRNPQYKFYRNGIEITPDFIGEWDVLRIMSFKGEDKGIIEVASGEITGKITGTITDGVKIDNKEYKFSQIYKDAIKNDSFYLKKIENGYSAIFATDGYGKITGIKKMKAGDLDYAFMIKTYFNDDTQQASVRLYGMYGVMKKLPLAKNVKINGKKYKISGEVPGILLDADGNTISQLIKYKANDKGEVTEILLAEDRTAEGYSRDEFSLDYAYTSASGNYPRDLQEYTIAGYRVSQAEITPFFYIPANLTDYDKYQFFDAQQDFWNIRTDINIKIYDSTKYVPEYDFKRAGAIVGFERKEVEQPSNPYNVAWVFDRGNPYVISSVRQELNSDDEVEIVVEAYKDSINMVLTTLRFTQDTLNCDTKNIYGGGYKKPADLQPGDIIRIRYVNEYAQDKKIEAFAVIANVDRYVDPELEYMASCQLASDGINPADSNLKVMLGTIIYASDYEYIWKTKNTLGEQKFQAVVIGYHQDGSVFVYDKQTKKLTVGTKKSIARGARAVVCGGYSRQFGTCIIIKE